MWHYQVMKHRYKQTGFEDEVWYGIHEYYPEVGKKGSWTEQEVSAKGDTVEELKKDLLNMVKDLDRWGVRDSETGERIEYI